MQGPCHCGNSPLGVHSRRAGSACLPTSASCFPPCLRVLTCPAGCGRSKRTPTSGQVSARAGSQCARSTSSPGCRRQQCAVRPQTHTFHCCCRPKRTGKGSNVTLKELIDGGFLKPGTGTVTVTYKGTLYRADLLATGQIQFNGEHTSLAGLQARGHGWRLVLAQTFLLALTRIALSCTTQGKPSTPPGRSQCTRSGCSTPASRATTAGTACT